jgi:hypothetical protein
MVERIDGRAIAPAMCYRVRLREMLVQNVARFRRWYVARGPIWTRVRAAGIAVRTSEGWIARRVLLTLGAPLFEDRVVKTDHTLLFERHLPPAQLPRMLRAFAHGCLPEHLDLGVPIRLYSSLAPSNVSGDERTARTGFTFTPLERFARFELKMSGGGSRPGGSLFTHELHEQCDREMLAQGRGRLPGLVHSLGLTKNEDELRVGADDCVCEIAACIPARISGFTQTADRTQAVVMTEIAPELTSRVSLLMTPQCDGWRDPIPGLIDADGRAAFTLLGDDDVTFTLLLDDYPLQLERFPRLPHVRPGVRERAVTYLEGPRSLTRDGLMQIGDPDANSFERAVIHLFGQLGYSGFWWGPNRQNGKPKIPMPPNASDCLVFSSDDAVVALVECTVEAPGRDKTLKLIKRAQQLQRELRAATNDAHIAVVPVLAAASHRDDISNVVRELCETDGLVLLGSDALAELQNLVARGAADAEISAALPGALRAGLAAERLFSRLF